MEAVHNMGMRGIATEIDEEYFEKEAYELGFTNAAIGAMVRSSYHADEQAAEALRETHGGCSHHVNSNNK
ncbi:MAG: hypothetical protein ACFNYQ_12245, partial [Treponema sp.]